MKKIEHYLHLYLGCDWKVTQYSGEFKSGIYGSSYFNSQLLRELSLVNVKIQPLLRPLSSMSQDEDKECHNIMFGDYNEKLKNKNIIHYEGEKIKYLLSKHFDLFGLIESGLAIDKTLTNE